jgi:thiosulfate/3-mercaptopyruvate sulfurtransferase
MNPPTTTDASTAPALTTLISADSLRAALSDGQSPLVIDVRFDLAEVGAGEAAYLAGHVPGSIYLHLDRDLSGPKTDADGAFRGRHPLPSRPDFAATLGRCGVTPATRVVALDAQGGMYAARLWWMLRWMGHSAVAVLDGGLSAWTAAGGALVTDATPPVPAPAYPGHASLVAAISADELSAELGRVLLLDARAPERFRGDFEPLDTSAGHIPGAINRYYKDNLDSGGRFKSADQLRAEFEALLGRRPIDRAVHQCGSGVTACHNLLAMEHAGLAGSVLYPGSWSEWSANPRRGVARGG